MAHSVALTTMGQGNLTGKPALSTSQYMLQPFGEFAMAGCVPYGQGLAAQGRR